MKYAVYACTFGGCADAALLADLAVEAEDAGWDGFFVWDHVAMWWDRSVPVVDSWVALTAIAAATERISIGPMVTPLPRRRPTTLARQTVSVDHLSGGRLILGVGLGANIHEFESLGEQHGLRTRARMLDEGLDVLAGLWSGQPVEHEGEFYTVSAQFHPTPVQGPRIPVWVAGSWPHPRPFARSLRWDGSLVTLAEPGPFDVPVETIADLRDVAARIRGTKDGFDVALVTGNPDWDPDKDAVIVSDYAGAGLTWWIEDIDPHRFRWRPGDPGWPLAAMRERIAAGPPKFTD